MVFKENTDKEGRIIYRYVVPKQDRETIMEIVHNSKFSGHFGRDRTLDRCWNRFYWPNMKVDIIEHVRTCLSCQQVKITNAYNSPEPQAIKSSKPME